MVILLQLTLVLALASVAAVSAGRKQDNFVQREFDLYKEKFGKVYASPEEEAKRLGRTTSSE